MKDKEILKAANRLIDQDVYGFMDSGAFEADATAVAKAYKKLLKEKKKK